MKPLHGITFVAILALLFFDMPVLRAQAPCYVRLEDASGYEPTATQLAELEQAVANLCTAFDSAGFGGQFKVYDFGFYLHHSATTGGYPEPFAQKVAEVVGLSPYYLLFGKETDKSGVYTRFWVDLKIPDTGIFECIDQISPTLRGDLTSRFGIIANTIHIFKEKMPFRYHEAEIGTMDSLRNYVSALKECCDPPGQNRRNSPSCAGCAFSASEFSEVLKYDGMSSQSFSKIIDKTSNPNQGEEIGYKVEYQGTTMDLDTVMTAVKGIIHDRFPNVSIKVYPFNFGDDCSDYHSIKAQFQTDSTDIGILLGIVGQNNQPGQVFWRTLSKTTNATSPFQTTSDTIYYFDKSGKYLRKEAGQGGTRGVWLDYISPGHHYVFSFADPIITPRTLIASDVVKDSLGNVLKYPGTEEPLTNKVMMMNKDMIFSRLSASTTFEPHAFAPWSLYNGSSGWEAPFDFSTKNYLYDRQNYLFITDDGNNVVAHNFRNMGNFLWGAASYIMGVWEWAALAGAHYNNLNTDGGWDTDDDQWSIQLGRKYAKTVNWKTIYGGRANIFRN